MAPAILEPVADAGTSPRATLRAHRAHEVTWDLTDSSGAAVPAGAYVLYVEVTDREGAGQTYSQRYSSFKLIELKQLDPAGVN